MSISWNIVFGLILVILVLIPSSSFATNSNIIGIGKYTLDCQGNNYDISYQVSNATLTNLPTDSNDGLVMSVQNSSNGIITVSFPRQYMDQNIGSTDYKFAVLTNGQLIQSDDITDQSNSTHRIMTINLPNGNFDLEIAMSGTPESMQEHHKNCSVIPEFGSLVMMIISISIMGAILIQKRFKVIN